MPLYFLHVRDGGRFIEDPEGEELHDLSLAVEAAAETARELLIEKLRQYERADGLGSRIEVTDEGGTVLAIVGFSDVLKGALECSERFSVPAE